MLQVSPLPERRSLGEGRLGAADHAATVARHPGRRRVVFLSAMKELPLTLLLAPASGLAVGVWDGS
jgi:hypothetical protein